MNPIEKTLSLAYWARLKEVFLASSDYSNESNSLEMFSKIPFSMQASLVMWINSLGTDQMHLKSIPFFVKVDQRLLSVSHISKCIEHEKNKVNPFRIHLKTATTEQNMVSHTLTFTTDKSFNRTLLREHVEKLIKKISER
jgi:hypothetical protein